VLGWDCDDEERNDESGQDMSMENDFSLAAYRVFNVVAETGNISRAAKLLYISQPGISKSISKLEQNLGVTLFVRSSRGVRLTEEGKQLYEYTKSAFLTLQEGENTIKKISNLGIGHIKIGVSTTLCKYMLLPYLKEFAEKFPHVHFTIQCQSTFQTMELLEQGKLDIGLIGRPDQMKELEFYPVGEIEDGFFATAGYLNHLKVREGKGLSAEKILERANLMLLDEKNITRLYIDQYFRENHMKTGQILEVSNMDLLIEFAKAGIGVACVIKQFVKRELESGELVEIKLPKAIEKRDVGFSYRKDRTLSKSAEKFVNYYKLG